MWSRMNDLPGTVDISKTAGMTNTDQPESMRSQAARVTRRTAKYRSDQIHDACEIFVTSILNMYHQQDDTTPEIQYIVRKLLNEAIWKFTEGGSKYRNCEWWTEKAVAQWASNRGGNKYSGLQLEHGKSRSTTIEDLLKPDAPARAILEDSETCVVTKSEHATITTHRKRRPDLSWRELYTSIAIRIVSNPSAGSRL